MKNFGSSGNILTLTAPVGGVKSGVPVIIGDLFAVPLASADAGDEFQGVITGVIQDVAKATGFEATAGDAAYWSEADDNVTDTDTDRAIGVFAQDCEADDTDCTIRLDGVHMPTAVAPSPLSTGTLTTGTLSVTGVNDVSGYPVSQLFVLGSITEGSTVSLWDLYATWISGVASDLSQASFALV